MAAARKVDPILVSVLDNRFSAITEEIARVLLRASRSSIFNEARDFATAIFTKDLKLIAQRDYLPALASAIPVAIKHIAKAYEESTFEGDIFIHNDAYSGNNHLPDINVVKPVFYKGELAFWSAVKGHSADIGGKGFAGYDPTGTTIWDDGLTIPACKLYEKGKRSRAVWDFIGKNIKVPELVLGDIACEVGAVTTGERRLLALIERYGVENLYAAIDEVIAATEREIRSKIRQIPDGVYYGEKSMDYDPITKDKPVTIRVRVIKQGDEITLDFSDSDPQTQGYLNSTWANTFSACHLAMFYLLPGNTKRNEGSLEPIKLTARKGTVVDPEFPASVTMCTVTTLETICEAIWLALSKATPQWAAAAHAKFIKEANMGFNPRTKRFFATLDFLEDACPSGGTEGYDGWDIGGPTVTLGQHRTPDFEIMELAIPIRIIQHEQIMDSEGAGKFRGGFAHMYKAEYLADISCVAIGGATKDYSVPFGLFGGENPKLNKFVIHYKDGRKEELASGVFFNVKAGDMKVHYMMGSPGFGDPLERDPKKVRQDVYDERVSIKKAKETYGVVIDPSTLKVDVEATRELRKKLKRVV